MAEVLALGVSHKTAPLELRERLALTEGRAVSVLGELVGADPGTVRIGQEVEAVFLEIDDELTLPAWRTR